MRLTTTLLLVLAFWAPPLLSIINNRMNPGLGSGLGVPIGFVLGFLIGLLFVGIAALATRNRPHFRPHYVVVALAGLAVLVLFFPANQGLFSQVR